MKPTLVICFVLLLLTSTLATQVAWQSTNGPYYANIDDYAVGESNGQVVLYAADSAYVETTGDAIVLKSTDRGETWVHVPVVVEGDTITGTVKCVATSTTNPNIVYAGIFCVGIYKSTDGGDSWIATNNSLVLNKAVSRIAIHPTNQSIIWVGCQIQTGVPYPPVLYQSPDGGENWAARDIGAPSPNALSVSDIALSPNSGHIWVSTYGGANNDGIWRTLNGGQDWTPENAGISTTNLHLASLSINPGNPNVLYCGNTGGSSTKVFKTTDAAGNCQWSDQSAPTAGAEVGDLRITEDSVVYAAVGGIGILKYDDNGWVTLADDLMFNDFKAIEVDPLDEEIIFAGTSASHYKSSDGGTSWYSRNEGAITVIVGGASGNSGRVLSIGQPPYVFRRESALEGWKPVFDASEYSNSSNLITSMALAFDPTSPDRALFGWEDEAGDNLRIWRTTNGGLDWMTPPFLVQGQKLLTDLVYKTSQFVFGSAYHTSHEDSHAWIIKSTDAGATWPSVTQLGGTNAQLRSITVSGNSIYAGGRESDESGPTVYKSTNDGGSWTSMSSGLPGTDGGYVQGISADPSNESIVYAGTTEGVYKTTNGGSTWEYKGSGIGAVNIKAVIVHPTNTVVLYAVTDTRDVN